MKMRQKEIRKTSLYTYIAKAVTQRKSSTMLVEKDTEILPSA